MSDIASPLISGLLALSGVGVGAWATMAVRRAATMADRERYIAESRAAHRAELKTAVLNYLEHAQQLQGELDVRERGQSPEDLKRLIEQLWLAEKGVEIICSDAPEIDWSLTRAVSTKWCVMLPTTRIGGRTVPTCSTR